MSNHFNARPISDRYDSKVIPFGEVDLGEEFQWRGNIFIKRRTNASGKNGALKGLNEPTYAFHDKLLVTVMVK